MTLGSFTATVGWSNKAKRKLDLQLVSANQRMSSSPTDVFAEHAGEQLPNHLEGEAPRSFEERRLIGGSEEAASVGLAATLLLSYEEPYELNTLF